MQKRTLVVIASLAVGLRFGATLDAAQIADPNDTAVLVREHSALTPENAMKM